MTDSLGLSIGATNLVAMRTGRPPVVRIATRFVAPMDNPNESVMSPAYHLWSPVRPSP